MGKFLYIEDDDDQVFFVQRYLDKSAGLTFDHALTFKDALKMYDPKRHGFIVMDYNVLGETAPEMARDILMRWPGLSIFVLTGLQVESQKMACQDARTQGYYSKDNMAGCFEGIAHSI